MTEKNTDKCQRDREGKVLMSKLKHGDDSALNVIMVNWEKPLASFLQRYTNNYEDTADLAIETFVRVYKSRNRYHESAKFSTWLFTIASNLARNHARWKKRHPEGSLEALQEKGPTRSDCEYGSPILSPDAELLKSEKARQVRIAINQLPADMREAVILSQYEEFSQAEIAAIQKCSVKAVESKLYRARAQLRDLLSELLEK